MKLWDVETQETLEASVLLQRSQRWEAGTVLVGQEPVLPDGRKVVEVSPDEYRVLSDFWRREILDETSIK